MKKYNSIEVGTIALDRKHFGDELWNQVTNTLFILTNAGYKCSVVAEVPNEVIAISYGYSDEELGGPHLYWLSTSEAKTVDDARWIEEDDAPTT